MHSDKQKKKSRVFRVSTLIFIMREKYVGDASKLSLGWRSAGSELPNPKSTREKNKN